MHRALKGMLLPTALLLFWELSARFGFLKAESLSYPSAVFRAALGIVVDGSLFKSALETFGADVSRDVRNS